MKYRLLRIRSTTSAILIPFTQLPAVVFAENVTEIQPMPIVEQPFVPWPILEEYVVDQPSTTSEEVSQQGGSIGIEGQNTDLIKTDVIESDGDVNPDTETLLSWGTQTWNTNTGDIFPTILDPVPIIPLLEEDQKPTNLTVIYPDITPFFDDIWRFDPTSIDSVNIEWWQWAITYCSLIARSNIEHILLLWWLHSTDTIVPQGDAYTLIQDGIKNSNLFEVTKQNIIAQLDVLYAEQGSTMFDLYALKSDQSISDIERWHRFVAVLGTNNAWYILDPIRWLQTIDAQDMYAYIGRYPDDERIFIHKQSYNPNYQKATIEVEKERIIKNQNITVQIPEGTLITKEDIWWDSVFDGVEDFVIIPDVSVDPVIFWPTEPIKNSTINYQHNLLDKDVVSPETTSSEQPIIDSSIVIEQISDTPITPLIDSFWVDKIGNTETIPVENISNKQIPALANTLSDELPIESQYESFVIGDVLSHLMFSKPVAVTVQTTFPEWQQVSIQVLHEWDQSYGNIGITSNSDATCINGVSSEENGNSFVQNGEIRFYTCWASTFILNPTLDSTPELTLWLHAGTWVFTDAWITQAVSWSTVQQWSNFSPQSGANTARQSTAARRPTFVTNAINFNPAIRFNATNSTFMTWNSWYNSVETFVVFNPIGIINSGTVAARIIWTFNTGTADASGIWIW
jgi:hypothetical protein